MVRIHYPSNRTWKGDGAVSNGRKIWWCDFKQSRGLLSCDPILAQKEAHCVALPGGYNPAAEGEGNAYLNASGDVLRLVQLKRFGPSLVGRVKVWTLIQEGAPVFRHIDHYLEKAGLSCFWTAQV